MAYIPSDNQAESTNLGRTSRIIAFLLLVGGIGLLALALFSTIKLLQLRLMGVIVEGQVVDQKIMQERIEKVDDGREYTEDVERYFAVVSFTTGEGAFTIESYYAGTNAPLYPTGSQVKVVYRPGSPEEARIQPEMIGFSGVFGPIMLFVFGAAFLVASRVVKGIRRF